MGNNCTGKTDKFDFETEFRDKYNKLNEEHQKLVNHFENELGGVKSAAETNPVDHEQINLLRYKVELLLTMLAMEEKTKEVLSNRVETLKWVILSQGTSEDQINELLMKYRNAKGTSSVEDISFDIDISSAFEKMKKCFESSSRHDIMNTFIDSDGNIILTLSKDQFIEKLELVTSVPKKDLHVLALRFFDGKTVSTTEFLAFFTTPESIRQAQNANTAVAMSDDILDKNAVLTQTRQSLSKSKDVQSWRALSRSISVNNNNTMGTMEIENNEGMSYESFYNRKRSKPLDFSLTKLVILWQYVRDQLNIEFQNIRVGQHRTISNNEFYTMLMKTAGEKVNISTYCVAIPVNEGALLKMSTLTSNDIEIIIEHFELGSRIHYHQFYDFMEQRLLSTDMFEIQKHVNMDEINQQMNVDDDRSEYSKSQPTTPAAAAADGVTQSFRESKLANGETSSSSSSVISNNRTSSPPRRLKRNMSSRSPSTRQQQSFALPLNNNNNSSSDGALGQQAIFGGSTPNDGAVRADRSNSPNKPPKPISPVNRGVKASVGGRIDDGGTGGKVY